MFDCGMHMGYNVSPGCVEANSMTVFVSLALLTFSAMLVRNLVF